MWHFGSEEKTSAFPLTQCEVWDNCMQHLLMANLMANAYEALTCARYFIGILLLFLFIFEQHYRVGIIFPSLKMKSVWQGGWRTWLGPHDQGRVRAYLWAHCGGPDHLTPPGP